MALTDEDRLTLKTAAERVKDLKWSGGVFWRDGAFPCGPYTRSSEIADATASFIKHATPARVLTLLEERALLHERVRALAARWRAEAAADAGDYYGDQFERRNDLADEIEALLDGGR